MKSTILIFMSLPIRLALIGIELMMWNQIFVHWFSFLPKLDYWQLCVIHLFIVIFRYSILRLNAYIKIIDEKFFQEIKKSEEYVKYFNKRLQEIATKGIDLKKQPAEKKAEKEYPEV